MSTEREYDEDQVREIFDAAVRSEEVDRPMLPRNRGLTLAQIQDIGREAGIPPERIAEAAVVVAGRGDALPRKTSMGMPVSVGRIVPLPRAPTDREWELLVVELRQTFGARGRLTGQGGIREWTNGNLHAFVEPTESGYRLRLGTRKTGAVARNRFGVVGLAVGLAALPVIGGAGGDLMELILPGLLGGAALVFNLLTLRPWAQEREAQMEHIADRAAVLLTSGAG